MAELTDTQRLVLAAAVHATTGHPMPKGTEDLSSVHNEVESLVGAFVNEVARQHVTAALDEIEKRIAHGPHRIGHDVSVVCSCVRCEATHACLDIVRGYRQERDR